MTDLYNTNNDATANVADEFCPVHNGTVRKVYEFGRLRPQPTVTTYNGCKCAYFYADLPSGVETKLCRNYTEASGKAGFALEIWRAA